MSDSHEDVQRHMHEVVEEHLHVCNYTPAAQNVAGVAHALVDMHVDYVKGFIDKIDEIPNNMPGQQAIEAMLGLFVVAEGNNFGYLLHQMFEAVRLHHKPEELN